MHRGVMKGDVPALTGSAHTVSHAVLTVDTRLTR